MRKDQEKEKIGLRDLYLEMTPNGWSKIVMPDKILIDNYHHGYPHIHHYHDKHYVKVKIK